MTRPNLTLIVSQVEAVSPDAFRAARADLLKEEKEATRLLSSITSKRRALPAVKVENPSRFIFTAADGSKVALPDLFEGRKQLIIYHFMLYDKDKEGCVGCSLCMDHIPPLGHLNSRDTTFAAVAPAEIDKVNAFKGRMDWNFPFYSSKETFAEVDKAGEEVTWKPGNGYFGIAVFLKEGDDIFHTYSSTDRGMEILLSTYHLLDMTPLGRQEVGNEMGKFRLHDQY